MDPVTRHLMAELSERQPLMVKQLFQFCETNSGTTNLDGLSYIHNHLSQVFNSIADSIESISFPTLNNIDMQGNTEILDCGKALLIRKRPEIKRRILLGGHMDTVYHADHPFQTLSYINENTLNGPGVADMKGGLLIILHALELFERLPEAETLGWDVFINADEEIGSPFSGSWLENAASTYQAGLIYEPAMDAKGTLARNRRGSGKFTVVTTGKAAHVGRAFSEGRNAICYLAEVILAIHALNGQREGVSINIGKIAGGEALNMVPDKAVAKLDIRVSSPQDEYWIQKKLNEINNLLKRDDYGLKIEGQFGRPVKSINYKTEKLFECVRRAGEQLNLSVSWQDSGGCCDGNNLAQKGLPVLDTMGVRGGAIHSAEEFILLDSLVERTALNLFLLRDLARGGLETLHS
ncbi:carboxypeptidase G2 [Legionella birminghamensis]|uniref:Carboxypeptidase G2 n=1 Tax=Legionella birminghamensis TaxID=28083 RepID=A0A378I8K9_9GAMM|nr:hydrolase [Legionella birminghamensis]KTC67918.1 carboxypeptidase G2 [Legionella birminghamensis]STX31373.1 carboxypeptidase G2 [Legionella birminghamensis]